MASLTTHLRRTDDHARLRFHPQCPICRRERLTGALPDDAIISRRSRALLAASVLAVSSAMPTAVLAAEADQEQEGATAPEQVATDDGRSSPDLDPGGQPTELPLDAGPAPEADAAPDPTGEPTPLEQEPATNDEVPAADAGDATGTQNAGEQPEPPSSDPLPPPPATESGAPAAPPFVPAPNVSADEAPVATHQEPQAGAAAPPTEHELGVAVPPPRAPKHATAREPQPRSPAIVPAQTNPATPALQPQPIHVPTASTSTTSQAAQSDSVTATPRQPAQRGDRFHVVQRGESLWSIAKDLLGEDASIARIAREVNRLWELNSGRIGTGEPDLLMAGTRIALR